MENFLSNLKPNYFGQIMSPEIDKITEALVEFQKENKRIGFTAKGYHNNDYADFDTIMDTIRPCLTKQGLVVTFPSLAGHCVEKFSEMGRDKEVNKILVFEPFACVVMHVSGQWIGSICDLPLNKDNNAQGYGGSKTYSKRFLMAGLLGITCGEPDDDGALASGLTHTPATIAEKQAKQETLETKKTIPAETKEVEVKQAEKPIFETKPEAKKEQPRAKADIYTMSEEELKQSSAEVEEMLSRLP